MLFAELERQGSSARRVILYPKEWQLSNPNEGTPAVHVETSLRLLKVAEKSYKVELQAISQMLTSRNGMIGRLQNRDGISIRQEPADRFETDAETYPLATLLSLTMFDRLIYLQPSGLIINSPRLDLLFTLPMESKVKGISAKLQGNNASPPIVLVKPSAEAFNKSMSVIQAGKYKDDDFLKNNNISNATTSYQSHSVVETSAIHLEDDQFNFSSFIDTTSYVHISDPGIRGPEFGVSRSSVIRARPKQMQGREVWEAIYERYRQQRIEVCGLDLEPEPEVMEIKLAQSRVKKLRIPAEDQNLLSIQDEAG
jgi:hypothetical protein